MKPGGVPRIVRAVGCVFLIVCGACIWRHGLQNGFEHMLLGVGAMAYGLLLIIRLATTGGDRDAR